jgi:hypothetical protein
MPLSVLGSGLITIVQWAQFALIHNDQDTKLTLINNATRCSEEGEVM